MLVGPKRVLFMDEISTGLDSSTTYQARSRLQPPGAQMRRSGLCAAQV